MAWTQRQHPRFKAALPIELRPVGAAPLRAQTADISLGGCYVEMASAQELSTVVEITIWVGDSKICAMGQVVSKHPSFGNGLKFTRMSSENQARLNDYLASRTYLGLQVRLNPAALQR